MANLPLFRSPFYNHYYNKYYNSYLTKNQCNSSDINNKENAKDMPSDYNNFNKDEKSSRYYSFGPINFKNPIFNNIEEPIFEIFGIQLYLDDIIILGLLFFLYKEEVKDEMLYISLILLLLS